MDKHTPIADLYFSRMNEKNQISAIRNWSDLSFDQLIVAQADVKGYKSYAFVKKHTALLFNNGSKILINFSKDKVLGLENYGKLALYPHHLQEEFIWWYKDTKPNSQKFIAKHGLNATRTAINDKFRELGIDIIVGADDKE